MRYTPEKLRPLVASSRSVAEVARKLMLNPGGGSHTYLSLVIAKFGLDTSHFTGRGSNRGPHHVGGLSRLTFEQILVYDRLGTDSRERTSYLRRALIESGVPYKCAICGLLPVWQDQVLCLHIDHINADPVDNRRENLRFLCPNCHTQTPNYSHQTKYFYNKSE